MKIPKLNMNKDELYRQISDQVNKMCEAVLRNCEEESEMITKFSTNNHKIKIVAAEGDGNCLFRSLAHQLFLHEMDSDEMKIASKNLRADVVAHIKENKCEFEHELQGRVFQIIEDRKSNCDNLDSDSDTIDMDQEIQMFLYKLSRNRYFGGSETLKAVSNMKNVNIIIFNEQEMCHIINKFGVTYERTIGVAYKLNHFGIRDHYDSVTDIESNDIWALVNHLIKTD